MIRVGWRYEIRQAMVKLSRWLLHLLAQEIERRKLLCALIVSIKVNIIANGVYPPKRVNTARDQQIFCDDSIEKFLRIVEKFARLFAKLWVFKNRRITAAQFPRVKKRRPIDVLGQRAQRNLLESVRA